MRIWLIKMLYRSLSPSEKYHCQKFVKCPLIDDIFHDTFEKIDNNWERSVTGRLSQSTGDK